MLCTMCMHGVNKKTTWDCECGETMCRHIRKCSKCGKLKPLVGEVPMPQGDPKFFKDNSYPNEREVVLTLRGTHFPLQVNGEFVKVVILDHNVASFYGGQTGEKTLLRYAKEPFEGVEQANSGH